MESVIDEFNAKYPWEKILTVDRQSGNYVYFVCPNCQKPNLSLLPMSKATRHEKQREWVKCFTAECKFKQDRFGAFMYVNGYDYREAVKEAKALMGMPDFKPAPTVTIKPRIEGGNRDYTPYYEWTRGNLWEGSDRRPLDYAKKRGISYGPLQLYDGGYDYHSDPIQNPGGIHHLEKQIWGKRLIFPTTKDHYVARDITGKCKPEYKVLNPSGSEVGIMGADLYFRPRGTGSEPLEEKFVFVVEGCFDCLSFAEIGEKCVAINSCENGGALLATLQRMKPKGIVLIYVPDNDNEDHKRKAIEGKFSDMRYGSIALGIPSYVAKICQGTPYKDCNDFLVGDKQEFINRVQGTLRNARARNERDKPYWLSLQA